MLKNEKKSFQLAIEADADCETEIIFNEALKGLKLYTVEHIKSDLPMFRKGADSYYRFSESGYFPDLLMPCENKLKLKKGVSVLWIEIDGKLNEVGKHSLGCA